MAKSRSSEGCWQGRAWASAALTARALTAATSLERVRREVCGRALSQGYFSECQQFVVPELLEHVFTDLTAHLTRADAADPRLRDRPWLARDGSLFRALPRMAWAPSGGGNAGSPNRAVRLHLSFHPADDKPVRTQVRWSEDCERAVWKEPWQRGDAYVGDRCFGQNYRLLEELSQAQCVYVLRLREAAVITVEEELSVSPADQRAGVVRQAWACLGERPQPHHPPVRVVWVRAAEGTALVLVTNLGPDWTHCRPSWSVGSTGSDGRSRWSSAGSSACWAAATGWSKVRAGPRFNSTWV